VTSNCSAISSTVSGWAASKGRAGELVAPDARDDRLLGQDRAQAAGGFDQHRVAHLVAVKVVGALELVEIEHEQGDGLVLAAGFLDKRGNGAIEAAPVEAAGQRIGIGELTGRVLGLAPLAHFGGQLGIAAPAEDDQRDVEQQGVGQDRIGLRAAEQHVVERAGQHGCARTDKQDEGSHDDAQGHDVALCPVGSGWRTRSRAVRVCGTRHAGKNPMVCCLEWPFST
jgi:hypothetical protein